VVAVASECNKRQREKYNVAEIITFLEIEEQ
jgi:hypothetical protein